MSAPGRGPRRSRIPILDALLGTISKAVFLFLWIVIVLAVLRRLGLGLLWALWTVRWILSSYRLVEAQGGGVSE
jgi:hypothetical protein